MSIQGYPLRFQYGQTLDSFTTGTSPVVHGTRYGLRGNSCGLEQGQDRACKRRYQNVGSGVFVGILHKGTSILAQCSECDAELGVFPGGTDQGQDTS